MVPEAFQKKLEPMNTDLEKSRNLVSKYVFILICPIFKVETRQSFVYSDGSERCTVRIVAMFEWSKSVICEIKC